MEVYGLEEKKAIESLIEIREFANLSSYKDTKISQLNAIDVVLNLIEKQSKEIEELKQNIHLKEVYVLKTNDYIKGTNIEDELCNKKWEDKIKAKIEELENEKEKYFEKQVIQHEIEILQSLLEKE